MMANSSWITDSLRILIDEKQQTHRELLSRAELQQIAEDSGSSLGFDQTNRLDFKDSRVQAMLKLFERQLESWKKTYWDSSNGKLALLQC
jgi:hypothetical protein